MAKLTIGEPGDKYELEADVIASKVMSMPAVAQLEMGTPEQTHSQVHSQPLAAEITPLVQHKAMPQSAGGLQGAGELESLLSRTKGGGSALPDEVRAFMEPRFVANLSHLRAHTGSEAVQMNHALGSQAFTYGNHIYYGAGKSPRNDHLTAHEVAHTFQQSGGAVQQYKGNKTIQRAVGYEIEYGKIDVMSKEENHLRKGTKIKSTADYQLTVDERGDRTFDLEVIVLEKDEQKQENKERIYRAIIEADNEVEKIIKRSKALKSLREQRRGFEGSDLGYDDRIKFIVKGGPREVKLQATVGLSLEALQLIRTGNYEEVAKEIEKTITEKINDEKGEVGKTKPKQQYREGIVAKAMGMQGPTPEIVGKNIRKFASETSLYSALRVKEGDPATEGMLIAISSMLVELPINARLDEFQYPKSLSGKLLQRTDFANIIRLLPSSVREHLKNHQKDWTKSLLNIIVQVLQLKAPKAPGYYQGEEPQNQESERKIIGESSPVIVDNWNQVAKDNQAPSYMGEKDLKLSSWYTEMIQNEVDLLTKETYKGGEMQREWLESMGAFREKYDEAETGTNKQKVKLPIFEFRQMPQGIGDEIVNEAMTIWELVRYANSKNIGWVEGTKSNK